MKEEPINPGYINQIFELSQRSTQFNRSEFVNASIEDKGLDFDYEVDCYPEYIRINVTIQYVQVAKASNTTLIVIDFFRSFRLIKKTSINPKDLLIVPEYCIRILNDEIKQLSPPLKTTPFYFPPPILESHQIDLETLSDSINACDTEAYP